MKKILLVEDDKDVAMGIKLRMSSLGYQVDAVEDALFAISMAENETPDVIILDINLPGESGLDVASKLLKSQTTEDIPIVFITASRDPYYRERATDLSAVAFLEKPFKSWELLDAVELTQNRPQG